MAEFVANALQTVEQNQNVVFTDDVISCNRGNILHRGGSGQFLLRGNVNNPTSGFARYFVICGANIAIPATGTVEPISLSITINGEAIPTSRGVVTPAAVGDFWNVNEFAYITVPRGCCFTVGVQNSSGQAIEVENANIVINRVA